MDDYNFAKQHPRPLDIWEKSQRMREYVTDVMSSLTSQKIVQLSIENKNRSGMLEYQCHTLWIDIK